MSGPQSAVDTPTPCATCGLVFAAAVVRAGHYRGGRCLRGPELRARGWRGARTRDAAGHWAGTLWYFPAPGVHETRAPVVPPRHPALAPAAVLARDLAAYWADHAGLAGRGAVLRWDRVLNEEGP